jgi:hypothetical protein
MAGKKEIDHSIRFRHSLRSHSASLGQSNSGVPADESSVSNRSNRKYVEVEGCRHSRREKCDMY